MEVGDVIQFNEKHKWCGSLGIITEVKRYEDLDDTRYMVAVPVPLDGTAYIFVMGKEMTIEKVGKAVLVPASAKDEEVSN